MQDLCTVLSFFAGISLVIWSALLSKHQALIHDVLFRMFYPYSVFFKRTLQSGQFPFWNPHIYSGIPFLANSQTALFYPFTYLYLIATFPTSITINVMFHTLLAGIGMTLLGRELGLSRPGAITAGIIFSCNGFFILHYPFPSQMDAYPWLPIGLYFFIKSDKSWRSMSAAIAAFTLQLFAGHPQFILYSAVALFIYLLVPSHDRSGRWIRAGLLGMGVLLTSSVQLIPTFLSGLSSVRATGQLGYEWATAYSIIPKELIKMLLCPMWSWIWTPASGDSSIVGFYIGLPALMLACYAIYKEWKNPVWNSFTLIALTGIFLCLGKYNPFYRILYHSLLPLRWFRFPAQAFYLTCFAFSLLAGRGLDAWTPLSGKRWLLIGLCFFDLFIFSRKIIKTIDASFYHTPLPGPAFLEQRSGLSRIFMTPRTRHQLQRTGRSALDAYLQYPDSLLPNYAMVYGLYDADGYDEFRYPEYERVLNMVSANPHSPWIDLLGIRYFLTYWDLPQDKYKPIAHFATNIFENRTALLPKAYFVSTAIEMPEDQIPDWVEQHPHFFRSAVIFSSPKLSIPEATSLFPSQPIFLHILSYAPNTISIEMATDRPGWVVLNDTYDAGWKAKINGKTSIVYRANYIQRAVQVNPGISHVEFYYRPPCFKASALISLFSLGMIIGIPMLFPKRPL